MPETIPSRPAPSRIATDYGPWALITGASDGIGRACAVALAAQGVHLLLVARREALLAELSGDLSSRHGIECAVLAADLARPDGVAAVITAAAPRDMACWSPPPALARRARSLMPMWPKSWA
jgi:uncharacterized protein